MDPPDADDAVPALKVHLHVIDRDVAAFTDRHRAAINCRPGCGECCHQTFRVSQVEGALLSEGLALLSQSQRREVVARARAYRPDQGLPCPLLTDDQRCSMYQHRPRICRKYGVPLWHPDRPHELRTCRLNVVDGEQFAADAEAWVETQASWAMAWIELRRGRGRQVNHTIAEWLLRADSQA